MAAKKLSAAEIQALLHKRYAAPAWAYLEEVRNGTGYARRTERYADGLAMSLYPSRGLSVHGFEIKVSRSDVLHELRDPEKSREIQRFCDHWWLVLADEKLIEPGELPARWGLMVVRGTTQLRAVMEAPKLESEPLSRVFVASLLRNFEQTYVPRRMYEEIQQDIAGQVSQEVEERVEQATKRERERLATKYQYTEKERDFLRERVKEFETKAGVSLRSWDLGTLVDAVQLVTKWNSATMRRKLQFLAQHASELNALATNGLAAFEEFAQSGRQLPLLKEEE